MVTVPVLSYAAPMAEHVMTSTVLVSLLSLYPGLMGAIYVALLAAVNQTFSLLGLRILGTCLWPGLPLYYRLLHPKIVVGMCNLVENLVWIF